MEEVETQKKIPRPSSRLMMAGLLVSVVGLGIVGTLFAPGQGGPIVIMIGLGFAYLLFLSLASLLVTEASYRMGRSSSGVKTLYPAVLIATGAIFLVGLQTLGQLQPIDVILVLIFEVLLIFYFLRRF